MPALGIGFPSDTEEITVTANQRLDPGLASVVILKAASALKIYLPWDPTTDLPTMPAKTNGSTKTGTFSTPSKSPKLRQNRGVPGMNDELRGNQASAVLTLHNSSTHTITISGDNVFSDGDLNLTTGKRLEFEYVADLAASSTAKNLGCWVRKTPTI